MKKIIFIVLAFFLLCLTGNALFSEDAKLTAKIVALVNSGNIKSITVMNGDYPPLFAKMKTVDKVENISIIDDTILKITEGTNLFFYLPLSSVKAYAWDDKTKLLILYM